MFTKNNTLFTSSQFGKEYNTVNISELVKKISILTLSLPYARNPQYFAFLRDLEVKDVVDYPAYRITFENNTGKLFTVECDGDAMMFNASRKYRKNFETGDYDTYYEYVPVKNYNETNKSTFVTYDWLGYHCKIVKIEQFNYTGPMYHFTTKKTDNAIVSGIPMYCKSEQIETETDNERDGDE